jgi:hypothetical protein
VFICLVHDYYIFYQFSVKMSNSLKAMLANITLPKQAQIRDKYSNATFEHRKGEKSAASLMVKSARDDDVRNPTRFTQI